jgi:hypothetical protein
MLLSPFFNADLAYVTPERYANMWKDAFALTNFREGDIFCNQDSIGAHPYTIEKIVDWTAALGEAVATKPGLRYWVNNESFIGESGGTTCNITRLTQQLALTAPLCEENITFSWNHYMCRYVTTTGVNTLYYNNAYLDFVKSGTLYRKPDSPTASFVKSGGSYTVTIDTPEDTLYPYTYNIYRGSGTTPIASYTGNASALPSNVFSGLSEDTYYLEAVSWMGVKSDKTLLSVSESVYTLDKIEITIRVGEEASLTVLRDGSPVSAENVQWSSSSPLISVTTGGIVSAINPISGTVSARCNGQLLSCAITVTPPLPLTILSIAPKEQPIIGEAVTFECVTENGAGTAIFSYYIIKDGKVFLEWKRTADSKLFETTFYQSGTYTIIAYARDSYSPLIFKLSQFTVNG